LGELKDAELANWETHKEQVHTAMQNAGTTGAVR
jgi:hypothetical protein